MEGPGGLGRGEESVRTMVGDGVARGGENEISRSGPGGDAEIRQGADGLIIVEMQGVLSTGEVLEDEGK